MKKRRDRDLTGRTFHEWTVIRLSRKKTKCGAKRWDCVCSCGKTQSIPTANLLKGLSKRCQECGSKHGGAANTIHGDSRSNLYQTWHNGIKNDCTWKNYVEFKRDVLPRTARYLVKKDSSKPYGPDNFSWSECCKAESDLEYVNGVGRTGIQWAKVLGITKQRVYQLCDAHGSLANAITARAKVAGISVESAIEKFSDIKWSRVMPRKPSVTKHSKLPWDLWTNGETFTVTRGVEFQTTVESFRATLHGRARKYGLKVRSRIDWDDKDTVIFRFEELEAT